MATTDEQHSVSRRFPSVDKLMEIYGILDTLIEQLGNSAYCAVNGFESLCDLAINALTDICPSRGTYFDQCLSDISKDLHEEHPSENVEWFIDAMRQDLMTVNCPEVLNELKSVFRHWSFPTLDEDAGMDKIFEHSSAAKPLSPRGVEYNRLILGALKRRFAVSGLRTTLSWSFVDEHRLTNQSMIEQLARSKQLVLDLRDEDAPDLLGWSNLPMVQTYDPSYAVDSREIIKNRGIFYAGAESLAYYQPTADRPKPVEWAKREEVDVRDICNQVRRGDCTPELAHEGFEIQGWPDRMVPEKSNLAGLAKEPPVFHGGEWKTVDDDESVYFVLPSARSLFVVWKRHVDSFGRVVWLRFPPSLLLGPSSDARASVVLCRCLNRL